MERCVGWDACVHALALACAVGAPRAAAQATFTEEAKARGLLYSLEGAYSLFAGYGVALADLDGDDDLDLIATGAASSIIGVFENDGTGQFTDRSLTCGLPPLLKIDGVAATDLNGDGLLDLVFGGFVRAPAVFRNLGNFSFLEVTSQAGLDTLSITATITSGDMDGDGDVDLFVAHYAYPISAVVNTRNQLWRNNGDGSFTDVAPTLGLNLKSYTFIGVLFDPDEDGDLDIYLSNDRGHLPPPQHPNRFFEQQIDGSFLEIGQQNGTGLGFFSMGVAVGDFTNDGITDLYCANSPGPIPPLNGDFPLFVGSPSGQFTQQQALWGVKHGGVGWACIFFDADNDGHNDLFIANQSLPDCLYMNYGAPPALDQTQLAGLLGPATGPSYGAAVGDVDGDGRIDLVVNPMGQNILLFMNQTTVPNGRVDLKIVGEAQDRHALGATVRLTAGGATQLGHVLQGGNSFNGQNGFDVHFGLGAATIVDSMTIRWPNTGSMRTLTGYGINTRWTIHPPGAMGDADGDGVRTQSDLSQLSIACGAPVTPGLEALDMNGDAVLDGEDWALLAALLDAPLGDLSGDGVVNGDDLAALLGDWMSSCSGSDLTGDGVVDGKDLGTLLGNWSAVGGR